MKRSAVHTSAVAWTLLLLIGCPALQEVQVPCESSLDCPTGFGCGPNKICARGLAQSTLTVTPATASLSVGASTTFTAKLDGQVTTDVGWSAGGSGTGTIDASGSYTAPAGITAATRVTIWAALKRHPDFMASATVNVQPADNTVAWVMSYFQNGNLPKSVAQDSLHLAYSTDGLRWTSISPTGPAFQLALPDGSNHLRDPFILRKQDGTFVLLATDWTRAFSSADYWTSPSPNIVVADSTDLITFTNPRLLKVTPVVDPLTSIPMHAWAPEAFYDPDLDQYGILWSGDDSNDVNRIYVTYTKDFLTLVNATPTVFFDPGYSVIDATLVQTAATKYLLFKDETNNSGSANTGTGKDIQIARSTSLSPGTFTRWSPSYITRGSNQSKQLLTEGPFVVKPPQLSLWYLCADLFGDAPGSFGCWSTSDLGADPSTWAPLASTAFSMPPSAQHSNTVRVTQAELDALIAHDVRKVKIKSTYVDASGRPFYLVHSWYHGIITYDSDTNGNQLATDFFFQGWPGMANPSDSTLVSIESSSLQGYWLRFNSATPNTWPSDASNQAQYRSLVPADQQNHLLWLDPSDGTAQYAWDATFKVVPALNGDPTMVSLLWCGETADGTCSDIAQPRYACHSYDQVFARYATDTCGVDPTNVGAAPDTKNAMSFTLVNQQ